VPYDEHRLHNALRQHLADVEGEARRFREAGPRHRRCVVHLIPFGVRQNAYLPDEARADSRRALRIPEDDFVILFRSTTSEYKGLKYLIEALASRPPVRSTTLLAVDQRHRLKKLEGMYNVLELGWVDDQGLFQQMYSAADVLAMPSTAEGFGLMALEAMAAGRTVVCFEGTSVESVVHAPDCGLAVPMGDSAALRDALDMLSANPAEARRRGMLGRRLAKDVYDHERYVDSVANLYRSARDRHLHQ
jgi:glycosyltransferase involved in cell wall biosynthesis